jgi:hypothetical protein
MTKYYYMKITKKKFVIHKEKKELLITLWIMWIRF